MNPVLKLPENLQSKYRLKDWPGNGHRQHFGKFGLVDLEKMSEQLAARLVRMGFPYIEEVKAETSKSKK